MTAAAAHLRLPDLGAVGLAKSVPKSEQTEEQAVTPEVTEVVTNIDPSALNLQDIVDLQPLRIETGTHVPESEAPELAAQGQRQPLRHEGQREVEVLPQAWQLMDTEAKTPFIVMTHGQVYHKAPPKLQIFFETKQRPLHSQVPQWLLEARHQAHQRAGEQLLLRQSLDLLLRTSGLLNSALTSSSLHRSRQPPIGYEANQKPSSVALSKLFEVNSKTFSTMFGSKAAELTSSTPPCGTSAS